MNPIIHQRPEPICETLALLYISENLDNLIRLMTAAIDAEGGDGMAFYHAHESLHRRYTAAFRERAVYGDFYDFFFHQMGIGDYVIIALPFLIDKNLTYDADEREEDALRTSGQPNVYAVVPMRVWCGVADYLFNWHQILCPANDYRTRYYNRPVPRPSAPTLIRDTPCYPKTANQQLFFV